MKAYIPIDNTSETLEKLAAILGPNGMQPDRTGRLVAFPSSIAALNDVVRVAGTTRDYINPSSSEAETVTFNMHVNIERLNQILEIDLDNLTARVEAGIKHSVLSNALAKSGLIWPVTPLPGHDSLEQSVNSGLALGNSGFCPDLRHWILGATLITRDGLRIEAGGRTIKNASGYQLNQTSIGARGLFGIVAEVQLRLEQLPPLSYSASIPLLGVGTSSLVSTALNHLGLIRQLSIFATTKHPLTAHISIAGHAESVEPVQFLINKRYPVTRPDLEVAAYASCFSNAVPLISWSAGPATCVQIVDQLDDMPIASEFVSFPLQRRGFVVGSDPSPIMDVITGSGGSASLLSGEAAGYLPPPLLTSTTQPFTIRNIGCIQG